MTNEFYVLFVILVLAVFFLPEKVPETEAQRKRREAKEAKRAKAKAARADRDDDWDDGIEQHTMADLRKRGGGGDSCCGGH